ncbi:MAG: hypothetical protein GPJ54_03370 [Candidatus Heimdallarchaeota archaeon]|nr:hypothetical protein [Candidatus Heimdallarchaeota archaeon]
MGNNSDKASNVLGIVLVIILLIMYVPDYINLPDSLDQNPPSPINLIDDTFDGPFMGWYDIGINFELLFFIQSGNRRDESYALYTKQALAPLGIDVKIFAKPWGQFVGDLTDSSSAGKVWDLTTTAFTVGGPTPDLSWLYHSDGYWGDTIMQLADLEYQEWQLSDVGLNQTKDIDPLIKAIDNELNLTKRYELLEEFNELFFTKLLWNIPLIAESNQAAMWRGFGGANNELWDPQEGIVLSSFLGASWDPIYTSLQRSSNSSSIRLAVNNQREFNLDPFQSLDDEQNTQTDWSYKGEFLTFDKNNNPHPNAAWNFFTSDIGGTWDDDGNVSTPEISVTQYTFLLRDDVYWHETLDFEGNIVPAERVDGLDYNLTLTMYDMARESSSFNIKDEDNWKSLADWSVSSTIFPNDTVTIRIPNSLRTPDDLIRFGNLNPLPSHLLGGDLIFFNSTSQLNETSHLFSGMSFDPWDTFQWNSFESFEGNTAVGPYQMVDYNFNELHSFAARSDYWYPNEWDVSLFHTPNAADTEIIAFETTNGVDLGLWGGSNSFSQLSYYHAWAEVGGNKAKPVSQNIEFIEYVVIIDQNVELIKFEAGEIDIYTSTSLGVSKVDEHADNTDLILKNVSPNESARILFFDLTHDHLKKINIRLAIAHTLDHDKLVNIHDGFGIPWWSVAYPNKQSGDTDWDTIQDPLAYDFSMARDLMRLEGYGAADSNDYIPTADIPDVADIIDTTTEGSGGVINFENNRDYWAISIVFTLIAIVIRKGLRKNF